MVQLISVDTRPADDHSIYLPLLFHLYLHVKVTLIKCVDPYDTSGQLELDNWLYIVFISTPFMLNSFHSDPSF